MADKAVEAQSAAPAALMELKSQYTQKEVVPSNSAKFEVSSVNFTIMSAEEILRYSEVKVCNKELYYPMTNQPMPFGVLDNKLGASKAGGQCKTCGHTFQDCCGHWGHVALHHPVFHVGYFKHLINLLYCICKKCSKLLLSPDEKTLFLTRSRRCHDPIMRRSLLKHLVARCKKQNLCLDPECGAHQGMLRRVMKPSLDQFMKIVLQKKIVREGPGTVASRTMVVSEDLDGRYIRTLLQRVSALDCEVLDVKMPEKYLISSLAVPPKCIRPSITLGDTGTNEDDLSVVFSEIVDLNNIIAAQSAAGLQASSILSNWEFLQLQCARFINSEAPAVGPLLASKNISSPGRGICQRLKGKEGRFRGNLSGKRVDFSGRTVISPDANCPISEVVIPMWSAKRLTFPERVCESTIEKLRAAVMRGDEWPGAAFVLKKDGTRSSLKFANRRDVAENLQFGDIVERHMWNGDVVLFNRQPSLHRLSIMAHKARVMPWRTFRFNECVCTPYNADFDGDEMNCHLPQTQEARAEAYHLMGVVNNLVTPKNGEPLVAATQDFLSGSYLLTSRDTFLTREKFTLYCCYFTDGLAHVDIPPPSIIKPVELWTGKQVINVLLRPNKSSEGAMVSFGVREREFVRPPNGEPDFLCPRDGYVLFRNSELISGALAKTTLGNGSKKGLFFNLIRENSPAMAACCMGRIAKLAGRWFVSIHAGIASMIIQLLQANKGMTIGIDDVTPGPQLRKAKAALVEKGYQGVEQEITDYKRGGMQPSPGCTLEETLEARVKSILDDLRTIAGKAAQNNLPPTNKPLIMFLSGAKGALINIAQMIALVGQQNVGGCRIQNGFVDRTMPHFPHKSQDGKARGFVKHSFYDGLDPDEFFFHTMSGREGLVDTAVKTAETGYMQRRLVKALEDLSLKYDRTVRTSDGQIVQFVYGDDGLDPKVMEDKGKPMSLDKVYHHVSCVIRVQHRLDNLSLKAVIPTTTTDDTVIPPTDKDCANLDARLQYHLQEAEKRLRQQHRNTRRVLAGMPVVEIRKRVRMEEKIEIQRKKVALSSNRSDPIPESVTSSYVDSEVNTSFSPSSPIPIPRSIEQKLLVIQSWLSNDGRAATSPEILAQDQTYQQAKGNVLAHLAINEWLSVMKQNVPLLPFEVTAWCKYLRDLTAEPLPIPLQLHQDLCMKESPTHQDRTKEVKAFARELDMWTANKVAELVAYRKANGLVPGDTHESYQAALAQLRVERIGVNEMLLTSCTNDQTMSGTFRRGKYPENHLARRGWVVPDLELPKSRKRNLEDIAFNEPDAPDTSNDEPNAANELSVFPQNTVPDELTGHDRWRFNRHHWISVKHLLEFFRVAWRKYNRALMEPGEAVGATGAQSIGEPGTQMTLKTFHFAGVASMNVTLGVPRIKEIINAANKIMTPIIQVPLTNDLDFDYALMVKSRIEKTLLGEVCANIKEVYSPEGAYLKIKLDRDTISKLFLDITAESVRESILATPGLSGLRMRLKEEVVEVVGQYKIVIRPPSTESLYFDLQTLKQKIQTVCICGLKEIKRGVIKREERPAPAIGGKYSYSLAVEGYGLREVMGISGVFGTKCTSNHVMEVKEILGIEAARTIIITEIQGCMEAYSMDIDCRHMQLLGDVMTFRGDVLGISRFGIMKMRASALMLASFEETNEHLFEAAAHNREDTVKGVSECIIMGKSITLGTGAFDILYNYKNRWTGTILDGGNRVGKMSQRSTLMLSKYGKII